MWTLSIVAGVFLVSVPTKGMYVGMGSFPNVQSSSGCGDSKRSTHCVNGDWHCRNEHLHCDCHTGWTGTRCDTPSDPCHNYDCGKGTCRTHKIYRRFIVDWSGSHSTLTAYCECPVGYLGPHCGRYDPCYNYACGAGTCQAITTKTVRCNCPPGYSGDFCQLAPTTTTTTVATTASPPKQFICDHTKTINDLSGGVSLSNVNASSCSLGDHTGTDALLLTDCNVDPVQTWKQGPPAMSLCSSLPLYTPIATFATGTSMFDPKTDTAGVFLGCLGDSIRVGLQTCAAGARIEHLTRGGGGYSDADSYFVIQ